ncbi:WD repeat-containing protein 17 [Chionoecetes opilio]|uniref:WD repeat-containing protein 17 n=1 Tax=Chionoecetes opilio TaxID=41210 RepID=A0A8J4YJE8_CHIOP|nr:WD repeat-containing protein 17 [Chionoecetes opilio]
MSHHSRKGAPPEVPPRALSAEVNGVSLVQGRTVDCARLVAQWHLLHGAPIIASCALMAVDDVKGALSVLLQGHELELVVAVGRLLGSDVPQGENADILEIGSVVETAVRYLTYRAVRLSLWDLAIELAQMLPEGVNQTILKAEVVLSHIGSPEERDHLCELAKFPPSAECFDKAVGSVQDQVLYLLLSTQPHKGLSKGLEFLQEQIVGGNLDRSSVWYVLRLVQAVPLVHNTAMWAIRGEERGALLALSAYLGAIKAAMLKYSTIVPYLLSHARWEKEDCNWDIDASQDVDLWCDVGITRVSGSHLPRHSDSQTCCITNQNIKASIRKGKKKWKEQEQDGVVDELLNNHFGELIDGEADIFIVELIDGEADIFIVELIDGEADIFIVELIDGEADIFIVELIDGEADIFIVELIDGEADIFIVELIDGEADIFIVELIDGEAAIFIVELIDGEADIFIVELIDGEADIFIEELIDGEADIFIVELIDGEADIFIVELIDGEADIFIVELIDGEADIFIVELIDGEADIFIVELIDGEADIFIVELIDGEADIFIVELIDGEADIFIVE